MTETRHDVRLLGPREATDVLDISVRQLDRLVEAGVVHAEREDMTALVARFGEAA